MWDLVIVGGGITGLAAAHAAYAGHTGSSGAGERPAVALVETAPRFGGKIATERCDGFLLEGGADSFARRRSGAVDLAAALGLGERLLPTGRPPGGEIAGEPAGDAKGDPGGGRVLVLHRGRLVPLPRDLHLVIPTRLGPILASPLLSWAGKLRTALEPVLFRRGSTASATAADESVERFLARRFGREYAARVAGPLLAGIHSTPADLLSMAAAFPHLAALERQGGSLVAAARALHRQAGDGPARVTLRGGVGELTDALVAALAAAGAHLLAGRAVETLAPGDGGGWRLGLAGGEELAARAVVLAVAPAAAARLLAPRAPDTAARLAALPAASSATVSLGFRRADVGHPLDALGLLVPARERRRVSACTFASSKFPERAPEGHVLLRAYVAGPAAIGGSDDELVEICRDELGSLLAISGEPVVARVHRFPDGNPQYRVGHRERVAAIEGALATELPPGLVLAGCAYHGVGIPDCVASGRRAAESALAAPSRPSAVRERAAAS